MCLLPPDKQLREKGQVQPLWPGPSPSQVAVMGTELLKKPYLELAKSPTHPGKASMGATKGNTDVSETTLLPQSLILLSDVINITSPSDLVQSWVCLRTKFRCKVLLNTLSCFKEVNISALEIKLQTSKSKFLAQKARKSP